MPLRTLPATTLLLALSGCRPIPELDDTGPEGLALLPSLLVDAVTLGETPMALVRVDDPEPAFALSLDDRADRWADRADAFLTDLPVGIRPIRVYQHIPVVVVALEDLDGAYALTDDPSVLSIEPNVGHEATLTQSLSLIGQPAAETSGYTGAGTSVAVLDTGANYTHADLGSCTAVATPASTCRVAYAADFATADGSLDDNGHGTNVSAIVAAVAPDTDILALDVFRSDGYAYSTDIIAAIDWVIANQGTYDIASINMSLGSGGYTAACVNSFSTSITAARNAGVSVAVASGNNGYTDRISSPACADDAISVGAVYDSNMGAVGWSSCSDSSTAADKQTCFSNTAAFLDVLAPGALIAAGGYTMGGTSQASPHVAGALAVLRGADPTATVDTIEGRLLDYGTTITDTRTGLTFPRLDLEASVADCVTSLSTSALSIGATGGSGSIDLVASSGCDWTVSSDASWLTLGSASGTGSGSVSWTASANTGTSRSTNVHLLGRTIAASQAGDTAPSGTVSIASGASGTRTTAVTLALSANDSTGGVSTMCISNTTSCTTWQAYATSLSWTLSGTGTRTVYAWFRDSYSNTSSVASDSIIVDTTAPRNGTVTGTGGNASAALSWTGYSDAGAGISSYKVVQATSATAPTSCTTGTVIYTGTGTSTTATGLTNGTTYAWRVCAVDGAGNTSSGATASLTPAPEYVAPTGSISINGGATWTASRTATVTLSASDASGVAYACLSNSTTCSTWFAMTSSKSWSMNTGSGTKTVYAWFKDIYGNVSSSTTDSITVDATVPTNGTVTLTGGTSGSLAATWTGFTDAGVGLASYKLVYNTSSPTASCTSGTVGYTGTSTSATLSGLTNGSTYYVRVCALDTLGNTSTGATANKVVAPEYNAPTGTISLNSGATWTNSRSATATLSATDDTSVATMCLSTATSCSTFVTYATSKAVTLSTRAGTQTVYAYFKDPYGNLSAYTTDTIGYDATAPTGGAVTATAGSGQVALSWSGFSDATSGLASYKVVYASGSTPASCAVGTVGYTGTATSKTLSGLTTGGAYGFRVCAVDTAGNTSTGVATTGTPL
jgi:hypothetical protein